MNPKLLSSREGERVPGGDLLSSRPDAGLRRQLHVSEGMPQTRLWGCKIGVQHPHKRRHGCDLGCIDALTQPLADETKQWHDRQRGCGCRTTEQSDICKMKTPEEQLKSVSLAQNQRPCVGRF